ncbi:hypothetical protein M413DRAFT_444928 [Hebeloma cylindrosporum]|uniref:Uncharacterized protein n=1 Tax=Hebeloma cylindrosporum TaxID=76867 RepID=A0A0C3CBS4_HEBCY|nr:hypothetical protein M413DRAFT_444928 [Hebeloma cylindrosporum h7]
MTPNPAEFFRDVIGHATGKQMNELGIRLGHNQGFEALHGEVTPGAATRTLVFLR